MSAAAQLQLRYPWFFDGTDSRFVSAEKRAQALELAEAYRPACLKVGMQDEAQAHYAAHLLASLGMGGGAGVEAVAAGIVKSETEGGVSRTYMTAAEAGVASVGAVAVQLSPIEEYERLARLCRLGGAVVSPVLDGRASR